MARFVGGTAALGSTCDIVEMKNLTDYISLLKAQYRPRQSSESISVENTYFKMNYSVRSQFGSYNICIEIK